MSDVDDLDRDLSDVDDLDRDLLKNPFRGKLLGSSEGGGGWGSQTRFQQLLKKISWFNSKCFVLHVGSAVLTGKFGCANTLANNATHAALEGHRFVF